MKQRLLSLLLMLVLAVNLIPAMALAASDWNGSTVSQPVADNNGVYQIGTAAELAWFRDHVNVDKAYTAKAVLTADIDLNGYNWTPIGGGSGLATLYFGGSFDGQGHVVKNFTINASYNFAGFFGYVKGTIANLQIKDADISSSSNNVGGIAGMIIDGGITNASFSGTVTNSKSGGYAGGIAGYVGNTNATSPTIQNSVNYGTISSAYAGGITAYAKFSSGIINCYNAGTIIAPDTSTGRVGGIVGQVMNNTPIDNCYNIGMVSGTKNTPGGITGFNGTSISNCYWLNPESGVAGGTGTTSSVTRITSPDGLLEKLGSAFVADTGNVNGGYPILAWQATGVTGSDTTPSITLKGGTTLYVQQGAGNNYTLLTAVKTNMDDLDTGVVNWSIQKKGGGDAAKIATIERIENTADSMIVRAVSGGVVIVTATVDVGGVAYSNSRDITIIPQITTASIANMNKLGAVAVGQTVKATIYVSGGEEYDYNNDPSLTYQWKYRPAGGNMIDIPNATNQTFTIPVTYNEWDYLHVEVKSGSTLVVDGANVYVSIRAENYGKLYPVAYDPTFTLPVDKKDNTMMALPATHTVDGVAASITWTSSNTNVINVDGTVIPPKSGKEAVTLTAKFAYGGSYANRTFPIMVWSESAVAEDAANHPTYLQKAVTALGNGYSLTPVYGADTNVAAMLTADFTAKGYGDVSVVVKASTEVYGNCGIASNGDITYFYADPNGTRALWFGRYNVSYVLTNGDESLDLNDVPVTIHWDANEVKTVMSSEILSGVNETAILGANTDKDNVTSNLILPKVVDDKKWSLISWTSSDAGAIAISNENQSTADTLFSPYIGKVIRGTEDKDVTLTAAFTFQRTSNEPPIVMYKTFTVTVKALSGAEADAIRIGLIQKLDAGFASAGLKDYVTGQQLNAADGVYSAVNDIQLPTTRNFGVDGKYYPVTITSSDTETIVAPDVANAARVMVYRPLVGEPAQTVTLTVTLTDKQKGVAASRKFTIEVQPLTQAEIDNALALMTVAKEGYFGGLNNGKYEDSYSVTGDLSSFKEAVWNDAHNAVAWVYTEQNRLRNGITSDELDHWEEQEAWRAFRSSDPAILAHESLHLVAKPEEDTFVRVNSVLTHEVFGKYWSKFAGAPGYEVFDSLYKQPVSAYIMVEGKNHQEQSQETLLAMHNLAVERIDAPIQVGFTLQSTGSVLIQTTVSSLKSGSTVFEVFRTALAKAGYTYTSMGSYVQAITDANGNTLSEKDGGPNSGWIYKVNGVMPSIYMNGFSLKNGDNIVVSFTPDYTKEGGSIGGGPIDGGPIGGGPIGGGPIGGGPIDGGPIGGGPIGGGPIGGGPIDGGPIGGGPIGGGPIGGGPIGGGPIGGGAVQGDKPVESTDGKIIVPADKAGEASLGNAIQVSIPADATEQELRLTIEQVKQIDALANRGEVFASPIFELLKNFSDNFKNPVTLTLMFEASKVQPGQRASIHYYDEVGQKWIEIGGTVSGDTISAKVDHFTKFAVLIVDNKTNVPYLDISKHWAEANITQAVQQGIVKGYPDGTFKPNGAITRAEFSVMLANALKLTGEDAVASFSDEAEIGAWAKDAIARTVASSIILGYTDGSFRPNANITRAELAVMIARAYSPEFESKASNGFVDESDIPNWATNAVSFVKELGIVNGQSGNKFAPNATATRAEAVTIIMKLLQLKK
ncbi:S-layer homology domain-containing protein [Cohnella sp. WQ 127256]|uniref:S-layer homology domain-containing protein n=1 Tax=Cohnella sp. WQ 127256 TaxID=2938790 RepID=UPI0021184D5D|nr:S-layer homology domain-containing protein [Cohnella sp. WQ 127256]